MCHGEPSCLKSKLRIGSGLPAKGCEAGDCSVETEKVVLWTGRLCSKQHYMGSRRDSEVCPGQTDS